MLYVARQAMSAQSAGSGLLRRRTKTPSALSEVHIPTVCTFCFYPRPIQKRIVTSAKNSICQQGRCGLDVNALYFSFRSMSIDSPCIATGIF